MKKTLSVLMSIIMLFSALTGFSITVQAGGWSDYAQNVQFGVEYTNILSTSDYRDNDGNYYNAYKFYVPYTGKITIKLTTETQKAIYYNYDIVNSNFVSVSADESETYNLSDIKYNSAIGIYSYSFSQPLKAGTYYYILYGEYNVGIDYYNITISYSPSISKPSNLKVSSRGTTSLKMTWNKIASVSGYQVQRKVNGTYKTLKNTSNNYYTISDLKSATSYSIRVRAYKDISGKRYYSGWTAITTCTKPSKPTILTPSTNSKHQITVKWKKLSRGSGYQVQFCKNKSCSNVIATKTVSGISKTSYTGKNFTKGRKYYVRVRAYKIVNNTKYYGSWSNVKSIKCK